MHRADRKQTGSENRLHVSGLMVRDGHEGDLGMREFAGEA
jgi:hypothetical protein